MTHITLRGVSKTLGRVHAVRRVDLDISPGELFFILGSSGSGKSTLLSLVAGLLEPTEGSIYFGEQDVTHLPTEARNAVLCFQSYALWPHMTVEQNVRFGLETRRVSRGEMEARVREALTRVRLTGLEQRYPGELSGGQQQRVALARALVVRPACLLLDEPLSNLDTNLRNQVRNDIRQLCKDAGVTTLYVTHDQKEALSMADRIAVMHDGELLQVDTPAQLFNRPRSRLVAEFISQSNLWSGRVIGERGSLLEIETALGPVLAPPENDLRTTPSEQVWVAIRPDQVQVDASGASQLNTFHARCTDSAFLGEWSEHRLRVGDSEHPECVMRAHLIPARPELDAPLVHLPPKHVLLLPFEQ